MRSSKYGLSIAALSFGSVLAVPSTSWADNPIVQTIYTADPAPMVVGDTVYLCTSHDEDVTVDDFFTMNDWRVYSSKDMVNWTDHGSPLSYHSFSWATGKAWAPHCVERDGKFYFYVPVSDAIGVAVADNPLGPYEDAIGEPLVQNYQYIDPTVFVDDDGQAYLYFGNPRLWYVTLNEDMTSFSGQVTQIENTTQSFGQRNGDAERPTLYEEGPWFYKRDGQYYMIFAMGPLPERIGYATSPAPLGPWTYRGVIMESESGHAFTNHAGVVDFKGKSYFFYHTQELPGGGGFKRSVAVEEFSYGADGSIPTINKTREGVNESAEPLNPFVRVEAETIAWEEGIETEPCSEGGMNVTEISDGDYIKVEAVEFGSGADSFSYRVAAGSGGGAIELRLDAEDGELAGTCAVDSTGGADTWATQECSVNITGQHDLFLRFTGGGFEFDWWQFAGPGAPTTNGAGGATGMGGASTTATVTDGAAGTTTTSGSVTASSSSSQTSGTTAGNTGTTSGTSATVAGTTAGSATTAAASTTGAGGAASAAATSGGLGNTGVTGGTPGGSSDEGGCSCGVVGARSKGGALGVLALFGLLLLRPARRRSFRSR